MTQKLTEDQIKQVAAQLRKPQGESGIEVGNHMNKGNLAMNLHTIAVLNPQPHDVILEIGMGNGHFVKNIIAHDANIQYVGVDYSDIMVQESIHNNGLGIKNEQVRFVCASVQELPFEVNSFDKIMTINTFYFWDQHELVLSELYRVLKKEGELILSIRPKSNLEKYPMTQYGFAIWNNEEIIKLVQTAGFHSLEITEITEPETEQMGRVFSRGCLIIKAKK